MKLTKKPANRNGEITSKCHWHRRREAVACGAQTRRGYCRACHAQAMRPAPFDGAIWLAALVALALALVGGVGCGGQDFTSMGGARPAEDAGTEGSLGSATGAGGGRSGGSPGNSGGSLGGSGGSPGGSGNSGGSSGGSGGSPGGSGGSSEGSGGSTITPEDGGAPEAAAGGAPSGGGFTGSGGSAAGAGGSLAGSGGSAVGSGGSAAGSGGTVSEGAPCSNAAKACDSSWCDPSCASQCWGPPLIIHWLACCPVSGSCGCVEPTKCL